MTIKRNILSGLILLIFSLAFFGKSYAWGFWAHKRINHLAVFTLPPEMLVLYKKNIDYLTAHAVDPDKRRYAVDYEAPRHYIDIDHYGTYPFDNLPRNFKEAKEKYTEDSLNAYGIVPWHINHTYYKLVSAFSNGDLKEIMKISADIGHYIGDSNVPLHTTENYNGQLTGQKGIHGLWESRLPELFGEEYDYFIGHAKYLEDVLGEAWASVLESHVCLDSVFDFESELTEYLPSGRKYSFENRGVYLVKAYSKRFSEMYHERLAGQVERRMRASILRVGSIWYTAWVDAGQPDLKNLLEKEELEVEENEYEKKYKIEDRENNSLGAVNDPYEMLFGACCGHGMNSCMSRKAAQEKPLPVKEKLEHSLDQKDCISH